MSLLIGTTASIPSCRYRPNQTMNFFVAPSEGHDDYLMSLALTVEASRDLPMRPRVARGRMQGFAALN